MGYLDEGVLFWWSEQREMGLGPSSFSPIFLMVTEHMRGVEQKSTRHPSGTGTLVLTLTLLKCLLSTQAGCVVPA
jgi:hypothetical protein